MTVKVLQTSHPSCRYVRRLPSSGGRERCLLPGGRPAAGQKDSAEGLARGKLRGFQLRWREAGDTEGEIEEWRNTQQGYGSFRQSRGQFFGEGERVISEHPVGRFKVRQPTLLRVACNPCPRTVLLPMSPTGQSC